MVIRGSVQFSHSVVSDSLQPHGSQHARPPCPSPTPGVHSDSSIESVMPSSHLILCHPLLLLPPIPPSIRVFSNESALRMRWPKYWSFSFSIIPSKEIPGLISVYNLFEMPPQNQCWHIHGQDFQEPSGACMSTGGNDPRAPCLSSWTLGRPAKYVLECNPALPHPAVE